MTFRPRMGHTQVTYLQVLTKSTISHFTWARLEGGFFHINPWKKQIGTGFVWDDAWCETGIIVGSSDECMMHFRGWNSDEMMMAPHMPEAGQDTRLLQNRTF